jgi:hypothetical protein
MLELAGKPQINPEDYNLRDVSDYTPSYSEVANASARSNFELNPSVQGNRRAVLNELVPGRQVEDFNPFSGKDVTVDAQGNLKNVTPGLDPNAPEAQRMSVEDANDKGKDIGLRFSEPPTQAQFNYLSDIKRAENAREETLSHAPLLSGRGAISFVSGLAASAIDPLNIAVSFVPIVGEARYAAWAAKYGRGTARALTGAAEGAVGTAAITPVIYAQAQQLQQNYDLGSAFSDVVMGGVMGSGLHWAGGRIKDAYRAQQFNDLFRFLRENDANMPHPSTFEAPDRRTVRVQEGDNAARHESLTVTERAKVLEAAVKSVENDKEPKMDVLFSSDPKLTDLAIPDKRFPATVKLRSNLTAADYASGAQGAAIADMAIARRLTASKLPQTPRGVYDLFAKRYKKLAETATLQAVTPEEFQRLAGSQLEHPEQRTLMVGDEGGPKTILVTQGASLGAVRHEVERALDEAYNVGAGESGGYRYDHKDLDQINAHRAAYGVTLDSNPDRATPSIDAREAVDLFSRDNTPIMGTEGPKAADHAEEVVNRDKDRQLDTMISDEEIGAIESIVDNIQGRAKELGIMDKVIPAEERVILEEAATRQGRQDQVRDLFSLADEVAEAGAKGESTSAAELLMRAGPEKLAEVIKGEKSTEAVIKEVADTGLVTRVNAARDIQFYLKRIKQELSGEALERAIRDVQAGEDVNVAVDRNLPRDTAEGGIEPASAPEPAKTTEQAIEDEFDDVVELAKAIIDENGIYDKRDLALGEAKIVQEEHAALAENPKTRDLFSSVEKDEFDAADRERALRQGDEAAAGGGGGEAGLASSRAAAATEFQKAALGRDSQTGGGADAAIERERTAPGGERSAPETTQSYGGWSIPRRVITPDGSVEVNVTPRIVEIRDLRDAEGDLQVRDRARKESKIEALDRANKLDPEQLLPGRVADAGAPIVADNGDGTFTVISGNGRVLSLREIYSNEALGFKVRGYRERIGPAADGYRSPVLVSVITDNLSHSELVRFAERANRSRIAEMSVTEKAQRDADVAGSELMGLYQGGDFTKKENQPFLRAFMNKVVTAQERGEMSKNGILTKPGLDRLNAAVLAAAYDDTGVLSLMLESTDSNIKSIASAYRDVAPAFMKLRADIAQGLVREEMDITAYMMEAARYVQETRDKGVKIANALAQVDALNPMDPLVDRLIRQFYNPQLTRANSSLRIGEVLRLYAEAAREKRTGGFLEDTTTAADVVSAAERRFAREADEEILAIDDEDTGGSNGGERQAAPQPAPAEPRPITDLGGQGGSAKAPARTTAEERIVNAYSDLSGGRTATRVRIADLADKTGLPKAELDRLLLSMQQKGDLALYTLDDPQEVTARDRQHEIAIGRERRQIVYMSRRPVAAKLEPQAKATLDLIGGTRAAAEAMGVPASADAKINAFLNDMAKMGALDKVAEPAPNPLRDELSKMKLPEIRARAKAEGLNVKGRSKDQVIDSYLKAKETDKTAPLRQKLAELREPTKKELAVRQAREGLSALTPKSTLEDFTKVTTGVSISERMAVMREDAASLLKRDAFTGKAKTIVERLAKKADEVDALVKAHDWEGLRETIGDMADDAARLTEIDPRPESNAVTQWVRSAAREFGIGDAQAKAVAIKEAVPEAAKTVRTPEGAVKSAFYDFLEGGEPIKGSAALAKKLGIDPNEAYLLLDEAESLGWVKLKDNGTYVRVPRDRRPPRPDLGTPEFADAPKGWGSVGGDEKSTALSEKTDLYTTLKQQLSEAEKDMVRAARRPDKLSNETMYLIKIVGERIDRLKSEIKTVLDEMSTLAKALETEKTERDLQAALSIQRAIGKAMHRLPDVVKIEMVDRIRYGENTSFRGVSWNAVDKASGAFKSMIQISKSTIRNATNTVNHEIAHALRHLGLFTRFEWRVVREEAEKAGGISPLRAEGYNQMFKANVERRDFHPSVDRAFIADKMAEEWFATEFGNWMEKRGKERETMMGRLFGRVADFLDDFKNAFENFGRMARGLEEKPSLEQVYRSIEDGSIARRYEEWGLGRSGSDNPLSVNRQAGNEFAAMLNDDMRSVAHDDSESISRAMETALQHMSPCASYNL